MLELARDVNLAVFYLCAIAAYYSARFNPVWRGFSHSYWIVDVILAIAPVYIFLRFLWGA